MAKKPLTILQRISQTVSRKGELEKLQKLPQFETMSLDEIKESTQQTLADYVNAGHDMGFLNYVFEHSNHDNPWLASADYSLVDAVIRRSDAEIAQSGRVIATTYRKRDLIRQHFGFFNPSKNTYFSAGLTSAMNFRSAFGTPKQQKDMKRLQKEPEQVREELDQGALDYLGNLQELIGRAKTDDAFLSQIRSVNTKGEIKVVKEAEELLYKLAQVELQARAEDISEALARLNINPRRFLVEQQERNSFFQFWESREEISDLESTAYNLIRSVDGNYPEEIKQLAFGFLFSTFAQQFYVNAEAVIKSELDDVNYLNNLSDEHSLVAAIGRPNTTGLDDILSRHDINLVEAAQVFQSGEFVNRRKGAWNHFTNDDYLSDIQEAEELFSEVLAEEGGRPVMNISTEVKDDHPYSKVLTSTDWQAQKNWNISVWMHEGLENKIARSSIQEMRDEADKVVVNTRKIQYLQQLFDDREVAFVEDLSEQDQVAVQAMHQANYQPIERFEGDLDNLIDRLEHLHKKVGASNVWNKDGKRMKLLAENWLFDPKIPLDEYRKQLEKFIEIEGLEIAEQARAVVQHPSVQFIEQYHNPLFPKYADKNQLERIASAAQTEVYDQTTMQDWARLEEVRKHEYIDGSVEGSFQARKVIHRLNEATSSTSWGATVLDGERLDVMMSELEEEHIPMSDTFIMQAKYLSLRTSKGVLKEIGLGISQEGTWSLLHREGIPEQIEVRKELVTAVDQAYQSVKALQPVRISFPQGDHDKRFGDYNRRSGMMYFKKEGNWVVEVPQTKVKSTVKKIYQRIAQDTPVAIQELEL